LQAKEEFNWKGFEYWDKQTANNI